MLTCCHSGVLRQYAAGLASQLSVAAAGSAFVWLEPLTLRLSTGQVEGIKPTPTEVSWLVATVELGCLLSPPLSSYLADRIGRKPVILSTGPLCLAGWALILSTSSVAVLFFVRILQGIATGLVFTVTPIYVAEIAQPSIRGKVSGIFQVFWYLGILYSYITGPYLSYSSYAWVCAALPLVFTILFLMCPESPYYLIMRGCYDRAKENLAWFRSGDVSEFEKMQEDVQEQMSRKNSWKTLFCDKNERKSFIILQIVSVTKFLTGMPTIVSYASETFSVGSNVLGPSEMTIVLGVFLVGIAVVAAFLSDWIGRKILLLVSCFGCFAAHLLTGSYYFLEEVTSIESLPYVPLMYIGIIGYCLFSDIGLGPLLQTLQGEMFGADTRGLAAALTNLISAALSFTVLKAYRPTMDAIGVYFNFFMYSAVGLVGGVLLWVYMYETAGKTIGKMEENSKNNKNEIKISKL